MKIETMTFVYNEEFLLPYYIKHYKFIDKFNFFYDVDSKDKTFDILKNCKKCNIIPFKFPNMMDDKIKVNELNNFYKNLNCDIIFNIDVDEFILSSKQFIENKIKKYNIINVKFADVFRNKSENDLDLKKAIIKQRRHGYFHKLYNKPAIAKTGLDICWSVGNHRIIGEKTFDCNVLGSHWANADICFCVERRVKNRKLRQSEFNLEKKITGQHHFCTEESIIKECEIHKNDPLIFFEKITYL